MSKIKVHSSFAKLKFLLLKYRSVFVIYDGNVREYVDKIAPGSPAMAITADEGHKTIETVMKICRWLLDQKAGRDALLLAVGGGVTTDLVGFAAGIYKRGIRYANVPTSLLAMVDAGIGGKTGVNVDDFKNMLGVIRQPEFCYICTPVLKTLPESELISGAAELIKTFIIKNEKGRYETAVKVLSNPFDEQALSPLIEAAANIKSKIVRKDPEEKGIRRVLNLGHTYGHAIEWWQRRNNVMVPYTHGEAVAAGIVRAAVKSEEDGIAVPGLAQRLREDLRCCGLPVEMPCSESDIEEALAQDKKTYGGKLNFVYIKEIGKVVVKKI